MVAPHVYATFNRISKESPRLRLRCEASTIRLIVYIVFALVASVQIVCAGHRSGQAPTRGANSAGKPSGNPDNGEKLFKRYGCYECHGSHGQIASRAGPALAPELIPFEGFAAYVRHPAGSMPPYTEKVMSDQDLADVYAFLLSTTHPPAAKTIPLLNLATWIGAPIRLTCLWCARTIENWISSYERDP